MYKRLFLLNGLAILGVAISHAAGWGQTAMYFWRDYLQAVVSPDYNPVGGLEYYLLVSIRQLTVFSVAAFLFVSGFFVAYAVGSKANITWKAVRSRIMGLFIPYLIWSILIFVSDFFLGVRYAPWEYLWIFLTTGATGPYYFVPLLCYLYLISPFLIPWAKNHWKALLSLAALIQLSTMVIRYLSLLPDATLFATITRWIPDWSLPRWILFFTAGLVAGLRAEALKQWLTRYKLVFLTATLILGVLTIVEYDLIYRATGRQWGNVPFSFITMLYSFTLIFSFLAFETEKLALAPTLYQLGIRSYGIYLLHMKIMEATARVIYHLIPVVLTIQIIYQPILLLLGFGGALLFMTLVSRSPARRYYRYLFS